ncbi:MAG: alpha/beta hydrolase family esterase [Acidimicrobiales bacterium]
MAMLALVAPLVVVVGQTAAAATVRVAPRSPGCRLTQTPKLSGAARSVQVNGTTRTYLISTPAPSKAALPLVLDFHGLAEGDAIEAVTSQFGRLGQRDRFIAVFPQGTGSPIGWDTEDMKANADLVYVSALLDRLEATQCINEQRVYATGLSLGAFMTSLLACTMSNRIAAFAPVSGVQLPRPCARRHVPILAFHGTADPILYFNGGIGTALLSQLLSGATSATTVPLPPVRLNGPGYPATVAAWARHDGCATKASNVRITPHVIRRTYRCPAGTAVSFYIVLGGGHAWPGSKFSQAIAAFTGPATVEINATKIIWTFFERFKLPAS